MKTGMSVGGAFLATLIASSAFAGTPAQVGSCVEGYGIFQGVAVAGRSNVGLGGIQMHEGLVGISDLGTFPLGTYIKIPALYGDRVFQVQDGLKDTSHKLIVIWHNNAGLAINFDPNPSNSNLKVCVASPTK